MTADSPFLAPLPGEGSKPFSARMRYLALGATRSIEKVAQECGKSVSLLSRWSARFRWVDAALAYDQLLASHAAQAHQAAYLAEVEAHRRRYGDVGRALFGVATRLLADLQSKHAEMEYTPASLLVIARAVVVAADLEAHALRLAELLPKLGRTNAEG